jgi:hypothetical protein
MPVRLRKTTTSVFGFNFTNHFVEYDGLSPFIGPAVTQIRRQFSTARIKVLGTFNLLPTPNTQYRDYDTGIPVTNLAHRNLRLGFLRTSGGINGVNNAAVNNTVYWGFTTGYDTWGHWLKETFVNGTATDSRILISFYYRSESVVAVGSNYTVKLYAYG